MSTSNVPDSFQKIFASICESTKSTAKQLASKYHFNIREARNVKQPEKADPTIRDEESESYCGDETYHHDDDDSQQQKTTVA